MSAAAKVEDPRPAFDYALRHCPEKLQITVLDDMLVGSARASKGKPPSVTLAMSEEQIKNLRGQKERDILLVVRIPHAVVKRSKSLIVLPGED